MNDRINQLKTLLTSEPNDAFLLYGLAQEYGKRGQHVLAVDFYDRAIDADPDYCYAYFHKALAQQEQGCISDAQQTLRTGLDRARSSRDHQAATEIEELLESME